MLDFKLTTQQMQDITQAFYAEINTGLTKQSTQLACLPTYSSAQIAHDNIDIYALDLGGSNLRAALVEFKQGRISQIGKPVGLTMPWQRGKVFSKQQYLEIQTSLIDQIKMTQETALGFCFSYPTSSQKNGDALLLEWTKGIQVPETVAAPVGETLKHYLQTEKNIAIGNVSVINDGVATLMAGLSLEPTDGYIGLIAGTGSNLSSFFYEKDIRKINTDNPNNLIPVNLESGGFHPPHLTKWDEIVDQQSEIPGKQRFEKAAAGMYLGRIFKAVMPNYPFDPETGAQGLTQIALSSTNKMAQQTARQIYRRAAILVACSIAGLVKFQTQHYQHKSIRVTAEGGLFWSQIDQQDNFKALTENALNIILTDLGLSDIRVEIIKVNNANFIGAAIAANQ